MGFINKIEQGLEKAVRGTFSKGGGDFEPVDLASRIRTDMDDKAYAIASGRTIAPNVFTINFAAEDFHRVQDWGAPLAEELCDVAIRHARAQGYSLRGSVRVTFTVDKAVEPGEFQVSSTQEKVTAPGRATQTNPVQAAPQPAKQQPTQSYRSQQQAPLRQTAFDAPAPLARRRPAASQAPNPFEAPTVLNTQVSPSKPKVVLEINGESYSCNSLPVVLGRGSQADITVDDSGVSRRHLEIMEQDGVYLAVDLGSTNGSYLNNQRLIGRRELTNGSVLTMGRARIVFRLMVPRGDR